ncbi:hypothetical protein ABIC22_000431 [Paenibacillus sp. PvP094]
MTFRIVKDIDTDVVKGKASRGLCNGRPRKGVVLRSFRQHLMGKRHDRKAVALLPLHDADPAAYAASSWPLHLHGSGFFSQRQRVILRLLVFMLLVHNDQQRPAFRGKRAGAS